MEQEHQDSYEEYKRELQEELGVSSIKPPTRPMNAYMRYFLEKSSQERSKREVNVNKLSSQIAKEWKELAPEKKDYYFQIHQIRRREWDALFVEFELLSNKRKILTPYSRFIKKRYLQYSKEYKNLSSLEITKLANEDWKALSTKEKDRLRQQFEAEKSDITLTIDRSDQISEYQEKLQRYQQLIREDKEKILRKYGLTAQNKARLREENKSKKVEMKKILKEERQNAARQEKRRYRQSCKQKALQEKERLRKLKEEQRLQQKQALKAEREKAKAEAVAQKQLQAMLKELQKHQKHEQEKIKQENVKAEIKEATKVKAKPQKKKAAKKVKKVKKIKKLAKAAVRKSLPTPQVKEEKQARVHKFLAKLPKKIVRSTRKSKR